MLKPDLSSVARSRQPAWRAPSNAMVAQGVLTLEDETPDAADRRKAFVAIATGVVTHVVANLGS